jgi:hypothetical protein
MIDTVLYYILFEGGGTRGVRPVPTEGPGWRKLAELMPNHVLTNINRDKFFAIMDRQRMSDKFGQDDRPPRPGLDDLLLSTLIHPLNLLEELRIDVRTLFQ